jgi:hypothetical protein
MSAITLNSLKLRLQALIAGTQKHTPSGQLTFGGASHQVVDLIKSFQDLIAAIDAEEPARAAYLASVQAMRTAKANVGPVIQAYVDFLRALYGKDVATLTDYGLKPKKSGSPKTVQVKAGAVAKSAETRKLRGTRGKRQKADLKAGNAPAPAPAPAPAGQPTQTKSGS